MITRYNIIKKLETSSSYKEKDIIVKNNMSLFLSALNKMSDSEIIRFYLNIKIGKNIKSIIASNIDKRLIKEEMYIMLDNYSFKKSDILKKYYPKIIKRYIVSKLDVIEELNKKESFEYKKEIVLNISDSEVSRVLKEVIDQSIIDVIINKLNKKVIGEILNDAYISGEVKSKVIEEKIDVNNILEILGIVSLKSIQEEIIQKKNTILVLKINSLSIGEVREILSGNISYPEIIYEYLILYKIKDIEVISKFLRLKELEVILKKVKNEKLASIIVASNPLKTKLVLKYMNISVLSWIYNDNITNDIKEFLINNKLRELKEEIVRRSLVNLKLCFLRNNSNIPISVIKLIIELRYDNFVQDIKNKPKNIIINEILYGDYNIEYKKLLIKYGINKDYIVEVINKVSEDVRNVIIDIKHEEIEYLLNNLNINELISLDCFNNKEQVISKFRSIYVSRLRNLERIELNSYLKDNTCNRMVKKIILSIMNISEYDLDNCVDLIKFEDVNLVIDNFNSIKKFINSCGIKFDAFVQYGSGSTIYSSWFNNMLKIISSGKTNEFILAYNLIKSMYQEDSENLVNDINVYLLSIDAYVNYDNLLNMLVKSNKVLSKEEVSNLKYLFSLEDKCKIDKLSDILNIKESTYQYYRKLLEKDISLNELKRIFNNLIFKNSKLQLKYIGGVASLLELRKRNEDSVCFNNYVDSMIKYARVIEGVNDTSNKDVLKKILDYLLNKNVNALKILEDAYLKFSNNIRKMLELDALINLSDLDSYEAKSLIDSDLSHKYNALVYDFRCVNYCLYAHVLSRFEKASDLVEGRSFGSKNFLSVSPISYLGQKYYFDRTSTTFAISHIPRGSFICSSLENMSTNYSIKNNSSEVKETYRTERGILETSAVTQNNAEVLLFREGVKVCGIILPGGREPSEEEILISREFNLPFILTQNVMETINNPKKVFGKNEVKVDILEDNSYLDRINMELSNIVSLNKDSIYTGREIAIITDIHSMYEPCLAVLEDIRRSGIKEIYSLGDNVGIGPNPHEVLELLDKYNVLSLAGNSEYYHTLGSDAFTYFTSDKLDNLSWSNDRLSSSDLNNLKVLKPSLDLELGGKLVGLCHFANDIRFDYLENTVWSYNSDFRAGKKSRQFLYTNSPKYESEVGKYGVINNARYFGYVDALNNPIFNGKLVTEYDHVLQGHAHFYHDDYLKSTKITSLRALAMGYHNSDSRKACYYVLKEKRSGGFDILVRYVDFNHAMLLASINASGIPHKEQVLKFVR